MYKLIKYKPIIPSLRFKCLVNKTSLWNGKKLKNLSIRIKHNSGRNDKGQLVLYTRSKNYHKKLYRIINFNYSNFGIPFMVYRVEYDPNRSSFINLVYFYNNIISYFLNINTVFAGMKRSSYDENPYNVVFLKGDNSILKLIPEGATISLIEKKPLYGSIYTRAAGTYSILVRKYLNINKALIKLNSGKFKFISLDCKATIGSISNNLHRYEISGKAGRSRWFGIKPNVRGVAMNPIDHPHGGGQGKKSKKVSPRSAWGKLFKWKKTSNFTSIISSDKLKI